MDERIAGRFGWSQPASGVAVASMGLVLLVTAAAMLWIGSGPPVWWSIAGVPVMVVVLVLAAGLRGGRTDRPSNAIVAVAAFSSLAVIFALALVDNVIAARWILGGLLVAQAVLLGVVAIRRQRALRLRTETGDTRRPPG